MAYWKELFFIGISIRWLRDNLQIIKDPSESAEIAQSMSEPGEVVFVPAFSGLYAPYWRKDARGYDQFINDR